MAIFKKQDKNPKAKTTKPAAVSPAKAKAQKAAQDLKVKALQSKAKAAKSKAASSKMRSVNTPMPLAKGQPVARFSRAADRAMGFSGKDIMRREAMENKDTEDMYPEIYKKNKTKAEKADSAFLTNKIFDVTQGTRKIQYNKVRKPKMRGGK
jgi:Tfp pilus assembly protein FimV